MKEAQSSWYDLPEPKTPWLVDGLITSDGIAGFVGKPKSGKSTGIRNLTASVVLGKDFIGRGVSSERKRVLYVHLDRKDRPHQVTAELKGLGITREDSERLKMLTEGELPKNTGLIERCQWLVDEVKMHRPDLIVIDMLAHFVKTARGINDYDAMNDAINFLQDRLKGAKYKGALVLSLHERKAGSEDVGDAILGASSIRGSLATTMHFKRHKKEGVYTIESDQTHRGPMGELDETIAVRTPALVLGAKYEELKKAEHKSDWLVKCEKVEEYLLNHPDRTTDEIEAALGVSPKTLLRILNTSDCIQFKGEGKKGDPKRFFLGSKKSLKAIVVPETKSGEAA